MEFYRQPLHEIDADLFSEDTLAVIRTHSKITESIQTRLSGILTRSTGYDHLAENVGQIPTGYLPDYATSAVANYNLAAAYSLIRKIPESLKAMENFSRSGLTGEELESFRAGIVGLGRIGGATAERLRALGVRVLGNDINPRTHWAQKNNVDYVELDELFSSCRIIFLTLPLTPLTRQMITYDLLQKLPAGSYLINSGRGEVLNHKGLLRAVDENIISGAALDVFNYESQLAGLLQNNQKTENENIQEELAAIETLIKDPRVIATPHNAFNTREALEKKVKRTVESIKIFQQTGQFPSPVEINSRR
jgi:D-lactate dehydrogenase